MQFLIDVFNVAVLPALVGLAVGYVVTKMVG